MEIGKICPFRNYESLDSQCVTDCQLFVSIDQSCALAALPFLKHAIDSLDETVVSLARTIAKP